MKAARISLWAAALFLAANVAVANSAALQDSVWGPMNSALSLAGGTLTGAVSGTSFTASDSFVATGVGATILSGSKVQFDRNGVTGGFPTTDTAPATTRLLAQSASPVGSGSTTGADLSLSGGEGTSKFVLTVANCGAADTLTVTVSNDAVANVCTRDASVTAAVSSHAGTFVCGASDQAMAVNVATCLNGISGIQACAGSACTLFSGTDGTVYVYRDTADPAVSQFTLASSGNHGVATNSTPGATRIIGTLTLDTPTTDPITLGIIPNDGILGDYLQVDYNNASSTPTLYVVGTGFATKTGGTFKAGFSASAIFAASDTQYKFSSTTGAFGTADTGIKRASANFISVTNGSSGLGGIDSFDITEADLTNSSCTEGQLRVDTGGATVELCYCRASNTWGCTSLASNPVD